VLTISRGRLGSIATGSGFRSLNRHQGSLFFTLNGTWLGLYGRTELAQDAAVAAAGEGFNSFSIAHNLASEEEVDAAMNEAIAAGAILVKTPQQVFWGGYSGYFKDPDGHLWELAYNPFEWIGPKDE